MGTDILRTLNQFASPEHERVFSVTGVHGRSTQFKFKQGELNLVDRVIVKAGNPLSRTTSGRLEIANIYQQAGLLRTPEHIIEVIETGQIESLVEGERSQLQIIRDENEKMLAQEPVAALATDYHVLHVKEHQSMLNSTEVRQNQGMREYVLAHVMEHMQQLMDPGIQMLQVTLGFQIGAVPPVPQQGAGGSPVTAGSPQVFDEGEQQGGQSARPPQVPKVA